MKLIYAGAFALLLAAAVGCHTAPRQSSATAHDVQLTVTDRGFEPSETFIPRGQAVTLVVTRKTDQTCATEIVIPRLGTRQALPLNQAVRIEIPAGAATDTLSYACGMNMITGTIIAR